MYQLLILAPGFAFTAGSVLIVEPGHNYVNGSFIGVGGGGSGLQGEIFVNSAGSIVSAAFKSFGSGYAQNPEEIVISFSGTKISQTGALTRLQIVAPGYDYISGELIDSGSISQIVIVSGGQNYLNGTLVAVGGEGSGFAGSFSVNNQGQINSILIRNHGTGYKTPPVIYFGYLNSTQIQDGTVTGIKIVEGGQNYIDGEFLGLVSNSLEISGVFYTTSGKIESDTVIELLLYLKFESGSITSVAFSAISTEGCSDNHTITASGGGGTGFLAISRAGRTSFSSFKIGRLHSATTCKVRGVGTATIPHGAQISAKHGYGGKLEVQLGNYFKSNVPVTGTVSMSVTEFQLELRLAVQVNSIVLIVQAMSGW
ncbi:hypothetical protein GUITHDRAFT_141366 [Guillardia theta CCMP2712]|uniref:Uncharacterized protein n=1 Tax=Guillardia theta (strain CCMP2712) TaxID=905079 RepID=L1J1Y3_GUITC|nr:hypothetical protein GUITHDRAFT_141366 [Guillardia theta CCMP2712]EKX42149.1 hypothetical protein GUITHDRAFT_141366 [Guillardia theta CCMP2712]|eukprot:XP_005829129.1 hypothetical protein GUITHDRAFT_141366 [Guillardia theta CCMP2712]